MRWASVTKSIEWQEERILGLQNYREEKTMETKYRLNSKGEVERIEVMSPHEMAKEEQKLLEQNRKKFLEERNRKIVEERGPAIAAAKNARELELALEGGPLRAAVSDNFDHNAFDRARERGQAVFAKANEEHERVTQDRIKPGKFGTA
jgi:hypothetical protein